MGKADGYLFAGTLTGFGLWNVLNGIVFHRALQLHHIKMDAASPFLCDLAWFVVFGMLPIGNGLPFLVQASRRRRDQRSAIARMAAKFANLNSSPGRLIGQAVTSR